MVKNEGIRKKRVIMTKAEFKEMYLKRMHNYWKEHQFIPKDYDILMTDGKHTDFCTAIPADINISMAEALLQYSRACREAVLNGGAIEGRKYTIDQIACTIFLGEAWYSESSEKTGKRPSEADDKQTVISFQFTDINMKEATYYRVINGELVEFDKSVVYNKNTN